MVLAGALLDHAEELLRMGLSPAEVIVGYEMACNKALNILPGESYADQIKSVIFYAVEPPSPSFLLHSPLSLFLPLPLPPPPPELVCCTVGDLSSKEEAKKAVITSIGSMQVRGRGRKSVAECTLRTWGR